MLHLSKNNDFLSMGIAVAHVYQLRQQFSQINETDERLKTLLSNAKSSAQAKNANSPRKRACPQKLSVCFTWYHYDPKKERYTQVRKQLGGGRRVQLINRNASSSELSTVLLIVSLQIA